MAKKFNRRKAASSLFPYQEEILDHLRQNHGIVIANSNKGLGPCAVELERYIQDALVHLLDRKTYIILSEEEALNEAERLGEEIRD